MDFLGLYVQVPFCASKCSFCNFSSRVAPETAFDVYCRALAQEIERLPGRYESYGIRGTMLDRTVDTIYVGGGTPSLLGRERLRLLVADLAEHFPFGSSIEFTLEVTPGSADDDFLADVWAIGINRLSVGAQSFDDRELRVVGRLHSAADTVDLVRRARRAGFANIGLDLIAGLPFQTERTWRRSLDEAIALRPEHLSVYLFEIDEKSRLGREVTAEGARYHAAAVPCENFMAQAYEMAGELLRREGYAQYEISNFALPGCESQHNQKYWRLEPYIGLGAGAHSFDGRQRWANEVAVETYQEKLARGESPIAEIHRLSTKEQIEEFFFLGLRERRGIDPRFSIDRWGAETVEPWDLRIDQLARGGWLEEADGRVRLTQRALLVSNEIFGEFLCG